MKRVWQTRRANLKRKEETRNAITREAVSLFANAGPVLEIKAERPAEGQTDIALTLCEQLEETIARLENRISNSIARLNMLIGRIDNG